MKVKKASTNVTTYFKLVDPTTGDEEPGLTITDLDMSYIRDRAEAVKADASSLSAADDAHADNSMFEVDGTNCPGLYRADWPDAAFATGVDKVQLIIKGSAIDTAVMEVELWDKLPNDLSTEIAALNNVSSADVNAACDTALSDYGGPTVTQMNTAHALLATLAEQAKIPKSDGAVTWNATALASMLTQMASALATYDSATKAEIDAAFAAAIVQIDANETKLDTVIAKTDLIPGSPAAVGSAMTLAADAVSASALKTDAVTEIVTAIFAKTGITTGGSATFAVIVAALYAMARGNIEKTGDAYAFMDDDDTTPLFTLTIAAGERTVS